MWMIFMRTVWVGILLGWFCLVATGEPAIHPSIFTPAEEFSLGTHGGIPFCADLDQNGKTEILWLQSPGLFHSAVFNKPPWNGRFTENEKEHFCLTATDSMGHVLWQVGHPWKGDRPFVTHSAERALDVGDIDSDGNLEVVVVRRNEILAIDAKTGQIENSVETEADNVQIVRIGKTGPEATDWTILAKNSESAYPPHEYANPVWYYDHQLNLIKRSDYLGAGHAPQALDIDDDGLDEFLIGFNLIDSDLSTVWTFEPVPQEEWDAAEMHVDDLVFGDVDGRKCVAYAASNTSYLVDASDGKLIWKRQGTHPQHCQIGRFHPDQSGKQVFVHNKRADLQLFSAAGEELWKMTPSENFPLGQSTASQKQLFHMFDPTLQLGGLGPRGTDLLVFSDRGWPYTIDGYGNRSVDFPHTMNVYQDWGDVPGRPDDYGYGYYTRTADFDGDGRSEVLINDRRFAWIYRVYPDTKMEVPRSDARTLHVDFENYTDGVVQALNAGVRWLGDPFSNRMEGTVEVTEGFAYSGERCAHIESNQPEEIARVRLQRRFDVPKVAGHTVAEMVFRPVREGSFEIKEMMVWDGRSLSGHPVGLRVLAHSNPNGKSYRLDLEHGPLNDGEDTGKVAGVVRELDSDKWIRIIQHRKQSEATVDLWVGPPGQESFVGAWPDLSANRDLERLEVGDTSEKDRIGSGFWDDIRVGGLLTSEIQLAPPEPPLRNVNRELPLVESPIIVNASRQLFVDDWVIESSEGLERRLHAIQKHPDNPLIVPDQPWEGQSVLLYGAVIRDPTSGRFRMWYLAWGKHIDQPTFICYAESDDGLTWIKPNLGLVDYQGSKDNNILMPGWSQTTVHYDPTDPDPSRRYKAMLRMNGTRAFFSPDGIQWDDMGVAIEQAYDGTSVHWDPVNKKWIAMVKIFRDGKRARGYAESEDFLNWSDTYYLLTVDENDRVGDQMYAMYMFHYETMYFGLLRMYHTDSDIVDIQLATSRNAKHWERAIRTPFIPTGSETDDWDFANNSVPSTPPVRVGDELWFYYSGRNTLHNVVPNDGAIGLGTLRLDGFVSMDGGEGGGELITKPLVLNGQSLYLNVDASEGEVGVEILREKGQAIDSFTLEESDSIGVDSVRHLVRWRKASSLEGLRNREIRLRFRLRNAKIYAFWME